MWGKHGVKQGGARKAGWDKIVIPTRRLPYVYNLLFQNIIKISLKSESHSGLRLRELRPSESVKLIHQLVSNLESKVEIHARREAFEVNNSIIHTHKESRRWWLWWLQQCLKSLATSPQRLGFKFPFMWALIFLIILHI